MKRTAIVLSVGLTLVALSAWLFRFDDDPAAQAFAAYQRGDYAMSVREYQRAATECSDLSALAVNQAAALYRLEKYPEADGRYQLAESNGDELRAARAAYDRGNCALSQACGVEGTPDGSLLDRAAEQYRACLEREAAGSDADALFADARHNLELVKLLQAPPPSQDQAKNDDANKNDSRQAPKDGKDNGGASQDQTSDGKPKPGEFSQTLASLVSQRDNDYLCPDCKKEMEQGNASSQRPDAKPNSTAAKVGSQKNGTESLKVDPDQKPTGGAQANADREQNPKDAAGAPPKNDQPPKPGGNDQQGKAPNGEWNDGPKQQQGKGPT